MNKAFIIVFSFLVCLTTKCFAQQRVFDMATTQAMVDRNKHHYDENKKAKESQMKITATEVVLKQANDKVKNIFSQLDKRMTSVFIVLGDLKTMSDVISMMDKMKEEQIEALQITYQHPLLAVYYYPQQKKIYEQAVDVYKLIAMIVLSYGDFNKIEASKRLVIFNAVKTEIAYLADRNSAMLALLKQYQKSLSRRDPKIDYYIDMDKKKIESILNKAKF